MDTEVLRQRLRGGENLNTEFKVAGIHPEDLAASLVAFANTAGGEIIFGVSDNGEIVGVENIDALGKLIDNVSRDKCLPAVTVLPEKMEIDGKTLLVVSIPRGDERPYSTNRGVHYIRIALAQMAVSEDLEANRQKGLDWVRQAAKNGAQMICFTELGLLPFFPQYRTEKKFFQWAEPIYGPTVKKFSEVAKRENIHILLNFFERAGSGEYYDTTVLLNADGGPALGPVRMMHIAEEPYFNEKFYYWPGNTPPQVFDLAGVKVGVAICYDRHFSEYTRQLVLQGAEIIFAPFAGIASDPINMYEIEMQGLAFQNQVFVAAVNRVGKEATVEFAGSSFVVDPAGEVVARAPRGEEKLLVVDCDLSRIEEMRQVRPFLRDRRPEVYEDWIKQKQLL